MFFDMLFQEGADFYMFCRLQQCFSAEFLLSVTEYLNIFTSIQGNGRKYWILWQLPGSHYLPKLKQVPQNIIRKIKEGGAGKDLTLSWQHWSLSQAYTLPCFVLVLLVPEEICSASYVPATQSCRFFNCWVLSKPDNVQIWANLIPPHLTKVW